MKLESSLRDNAGFLYTAPLLDVVLLLLIFFLLSSTFIVKSGISVEVPTSNASLPPLEGSHVVTVLGGPIQQIYFNEHRIAREDLRKFLERETEIRHVIIRADRTAYFGLVIDISNELTDGGYEVAFATTDREAQP